MAMMMLEVENHGTALEDAAGRGTIHGILRTIQPSFGFGRTEVMVM